MFKQIWQRFSVAIVAMMVLLMIGIFMILQAFLHYSKDLPDYKQLSNYNPPLITRVYTSDGQLLRALAVQKRIYMEYENIPPLIVNAFVAAEDKNFFEHSGVDVFSIIRAAVQNLLNYGRDKNPVGGSTITQQVIKNFLLNNEQTYTRKIKEAILSYRVSKAYSKEKIMELYLNEIFMGDGAYGVVVAAQHYFDKDLDELTIEEAAMLAAMPKSPTYLNPKKYYRKALNRRNWVIDRMEKEDFITETEANQAKLAPIKLFDRADTPVADFPYYAEEVRRQLINMFGKDAVYSKGYTVITNLVPSIQKNLDDAFISGVRSYQYRYGYLGALAKADKENKDWLSELKKVPTPADIREFKMAIVLGFEGKDAKIGLADGSQGKIEHKDLKWARKALRNKSVGTSINSAQDVLRVYDVIVVANLGGGKYKLEHIPDVNGAMMAMEPYSGKILGFIGGYSFEKSSFNRAFQAKRQPGSAFKLFVYLAALENGYAPNTIVLDEPVSLSQGRGMPMWTPKNYGNSYLGPITIRQALEKSRNVSTVRLLRSVGLKKVVKLSERLGIYKTPPSNYSVALGAFETTLVDILNAYNTLNSEGKKTVPSLISAVYDNDGNLLYRAENSSCKSCDSELVDFLSYEEPTVEYNLEQSIDPVTNYQIVSFLEGVVKRGTGRRALTVKKTLAGKTGTTNESFDNWFVGFSPDISAGVYIGYDQPRTLGSRSTGSNTALPLFVDFMQSTLEGVDDKQFSVPPGVKLINVNYHSGSVTSAPADGRSVVTEAFRDNKYGKRSRWGDFGDEDAGYEGYDYDDLQPETEADDSGYLGDDLFDDNLRSPQNQRSRDTNNFLLDRENYQEFDYNGDANSPFDTRSGGGEFDRVY